MNGSAGPSDADFPPELASETIARLYESQGLPHKAATIRALCARPACVEAHHRDGAVDITWQVSSSGPLWLRAVTFVAGAAPDVADFAAEPAGTMRLPGGVGWTCVAIGREKDGRFVPLAHAAPVRIDAVNEHR